MEGNVTDQAPSGLPGEERTPQHYSDIEAEKLLMSEQECSFRSRLSKGLKTHTKKTCSHF